MQERLVCPQIDTHVHHSACMHQKHLLRFIKSKLRKEPNEVVIFRDGKYLTLKEVFESLNLTGCVLAAWVHCPTACMSTRSGACFADQSRSSQAWKGAIQHPCCPVLVFSYF